MHVRQEDVLQRANKLWEMRFILPEHKAALLQQKKEQEKIPKPELDEQELNELALVVMESLHYEIVVRITYWKDGSFHECTGIVDKVDTITQHLKLKCDDDDVDYIHLTCLKHIERL